MEIPGAQGALTRRPAGRLTIVPRFRYVVDDLSTATDGELESRLLTALAHLALRLLRDLRHRPTMDVLEDLREIFERLEQTDTPAHARRGASKDLSKGVSWRAARSS